MTRTIYYTAATLDGFLADERDSLDWLFVQDNDADGPMGYTSFIAGIGAIAMGATTYEWVVAHLQRSGEAWGYDVPSFVFTHRDLAPVADSVTIVSGAAADVHADLVATAGERDVWVVGGGDLAAQFADAGLLDEVQVSIAPVVLGTGRPLFPRRYDLRLTRLERNGDFACAWYDVVGPGSWPAPEADG